MRPLAANGCHACYPPIRGRFAKAGDWDEMSLRRASRRGGLLALPSHRRGPFGNATARCWGPGAPAGTTYLLPSLVWADQQHSRGVTRRSRRTPTNLMRWDVSYASRTDARRPYGAPGACTAGWTGSRRTFSAGARQGQRQRLPSRQPLTTSGTPAWTRRYARP